MASRAPASTGGPLVGLIGWPQETNLELVEAWRARGVNDVYEDAAAALGLLRTRAAA
jgi:hypothetical protein